MHKVCCNQILSLNKKSKNYRYKKIEEKNQNKANKYLYFIILTIVSDVHLYLLSICAEILQCEHFLNKRKLKIRLIFSL